MKRWVLTCAFLFTCCVSAWAGVPANLPTLDDPALQKFLRSLLDHLNTLECLTGDPNGSVIGVHGELKCANFSGSDYICMNTSTGPEQGTAWICVTAVANSFTAAGDSGTSQTIANGDTLHLITVANTGGGSSGSGLSTVASATDTITFKFDSTKVNGLSDPVVWGDGTTDQTWNFNAAGAINPRISFTNGAITIAPGQFVGGNGLIVGDQLTLNGMANPRFTLTPNVGFATQFADNGTTFSILETATSTHLLDWTIGTNVLSFGGATTLGAGLTLTGAAPAIILQPNTGVRFEQSTEGVSWLFANLTDVIHLFVLGKDGSPYFPQRKGCNFLTTTAAEGRVDCGSALTLSTLSLTDKITTYNNIATVANGVPSEVAAINTTGLLANVGATLLYAVPASAGGLYRVAVLVVETTAGSVSSTLPNVQIVYTDNETGGSITIDATPILGAAGIGQTGALTANTVGTTSTGLIAINPAASSNINYQTVNYASTLAGMTYALHVKLEAL